MTIVYGTAWKEERTAALVEAALAAGFRAIDTANQRKHYFEAAVGAGIAASGVPRDQLWLQTKFTYQRGQDHRLPYDPAAPYGDQVRQSFASSLEHLGVARIDSLVLHGPEHGNGWSRADREVWEAMEGLVDTGKVGALGLSNATRAQVEEACRVARIAPAAVQNRCYARYGWDADVRALCRERGMAYQGFSLLTANRAELQRPVMSELAARRGATVPQLVFRFALAVGMTPLTGTSSRQHMEEDLAAPALELDAGEIATLEAIGR